MLVSDDPGIRSFRSVRSFLSNLNSSQIPDLESNSVKVLKFLHLSATLPPGLVSMGLWSWIHSQDSSIRHELLDRIQFKNEMVLSKANQTRLFSATGEQIKFPEHLLSSNEASNKNIDSNTKSDMNRKLVHDLYNISIEEYTKTTRRFFIQIVDASLKSNNYEHVIFTVKCSYQQQISVRHMVVKEGSKANGFFVHASEGFIFDVNDDKFNISITMHAYDSGSNSGLGSLVRKPSFLMFRAQSRKNDQIRMKSHGTNEPISFVPHPSLLGQVIGELQFAIPLLTRDQKSSGTYTLVNGKKEVAKVFLKMGIYDDVQIIQSDVEKEIAKIPDMPLFADFLNVLNESNTLWKKYWVVYRDYALHFFDFEYKEGKDELENLNILSIENVMHPDPSLFCYSNSLELQLSTKALDENEWIHSLVGKSDSTDSPKLYVSADSKLKRDEWFERLSTLVIKPQDKSKVMKEKSRYGGVPQLPPRK